MAGDGGWRKAKRKDPEPGSVEPSPSGASRVRCEPTALTSAALRSHPTRPAPHKGCPLITKAKIPFPSRPTKPRAGNAKAPALDPDDYRDEVLSEIDPRSLAQARDALIVQTDRLHRLRSEKDEAVAETTRIDAELQQTRAQWKKRWTRMTRRPPRYVTSNASWTMPRRRSGARSPGATRTPRRWKKRDLR